MGSVDLSDAPSYCTHDAQWFRIPPTGKWKWAKHPPLRGKLKAVAASCWTKDMFKLRPKAWMPWLTEAAAAYPKEMNRYLARKILMAALDVRVRRLKSYTATSMVRVGRFGGTIVREPMVNARNSGEVFEGTELVDRKIAFTQPLRGNAPMQAERKNLAEERAVLGGLRHPWKSAEKISRVYDVGRKIRAALMDVLSR